MNKAVKVGVGVIIIQDNRILLGERIGAHGANTWATPGGHLEIGESIEDCARREVFEETGLALNTVKHLAFTNDIFYQEKTHYVTLFVTATCDEGIAKITEPDKCLQWQWYELDNLPTPLFLPMINLFNEHKALISKLLS